MSPARIFTAQSGTLAMLLACAIGAVGCGRRNIMRVPAAFVPPASSLPAAAAPRVSAAAPRVATGAPQAPDAASPQAISETETGIASWYGVPYHGRRAASGEVYDMEQLTAAHRTLPFETWVEVTNLNNDRRVDVRITDRGPFVDGRIIDLSLAAARELDMVRAGLAPVRLRIIDPPAASQSDITAAESPSGSPPASGYAVQAGAFSEQARAEAFRDALPFADVRVVRAPESSLWRVFVGRSLNMDAATRLAQDVRKTTGEAFVVHDR